MPVRGSGGDVTKGNMGGADSAARRRCAPRGARLTAAHLSPSGARGPHPTSKGCLLRGGAQAARCPLPLQLYTGHTWGHCRDLGGVGQAPPEARPAPSATSHPLTEPLSCRPYKGRGGPTARSADLNACGQGPACISGGKGRRKEPRSPRGQGSGCCGGGSQMPHRGHRGHRGQPGRVGLGDRETAKQKEEEGGKGTGHQDTRLPEKGTWGGWPQLWPSWVAPAHG